MIDDLPVKLIIVLFACPIMFYPGVYPGKCNTCTFNISSGATLRLNTNATCYNCTINGGIVTMTEGQPFSPLNKQEAVSSNTSFPYVDPSPTQGDKRQQLAIHVVSGKKTGTFSHLYLP